MDASQSHLSQPQFGYDFVVAVTQESINAAMKLFLHNLKAPEAIICYVADENGNPQAIDYTTLLANAKGSDPFAIPDNANPKTDPNIQNLLNARFMTGFKAKIGLPPGVLPAEIPDVVVLKNGIAAVTFRLLCSEFTVVQLVPGGGYNTAPTWMNKSQPDDAPWTFVSSVDLRLSDVDLGAYSNLPDDIKKQIKNLGANAFSIQQLLYDLDNAALETVPEIDGVQPGTNLYMCLQRDFIGKYFTTLQTTSQPVLAYGIKQTNVDASTLKLTDMDLYINPLNDSNGTPIKNPDAAQQNLYTLNYLCASNGHTLPPPATFPWNWVNDPSQAAKYHGVVAINKNAFVKYFRSRLDAFVPNSCIKPWVRVTYDAKDIKVHYNWELHAGQTPTIETPDADATVLRYSYEASDDDQAGLHGDEGKMKLQSNYNLTVTFSSNTITVVQSLKIYVDIHLEKAKADGNMVDKTITDVYTLSINGNGRLVADLNSTTEDNSRTPGVNKFLNFFDRVSDLRDDAKKYIDAFVSHKFNDIPLSFVQDFVFPAGNTFAFKDVFFSAGQDLITHITYVDPTSAGQ